MRTITCHFQNQADLLKHVRQPSPFCPPDILTFLAEFDASPHEEFKATLVMEDTQAQCTIRVKPAHRTPAQHEPMWSYVNQIHQQDQIWLQMFLSKIQTMTSFRDALAA